MRVVIWILKCYPRRWRERYQEEMLAVLEQHTISIMTILDMVLGALDARLDPAYRTKEGFMFHKLRDTRTLVLMYICTLVIFSFSVTLWTMLNGSLSFQDNPLGSSTEAIASTIGAAIMPALNLVALLVTAVTLLINALKNRHFGICLFAVVCFSLGIAGVSQVLPLSPGPDYPLLNLIFAWLFIGGIALCVGAGLFVIGVKGLQAIRDRQWQSIGFALVIGLLFPAGLIIYDLWGLAGSSGGTLRLSPGSFMVGNVIFGSLAVFIAFLLFEMAPYFVLGALLLVLTSRTPSVRNWRVIRGSGILFTIVMAINLVTIVVWDINRWLSGGVWIFNPKQGVWPLFGGQWIGPLITNALILAIALGFALLALIRSFLIQPEDEQPLERLTA